MRQKTRSSRKQAQLAFAWNEAGEAQPELRPGFSPHSYGFRPGKSAHQALTAAQAHVASGKRWVVDLDLEKFFDRVNHDVLLGRLARKIGDKRLLGLIRRYLEAGILCAGVVLTREEGTPQGGYRFAPCCSVN